MLNARDLELRRRSLGASEIGIVAGHSIYLDRTPFSVWSAKVFGDRFESTDEMVAGSFMERGVARLYQHVLDEPVRLVRGRRRVRADSRWISATPDYFVFARGSTSRASAECLRVLECKWVGPGQEDHWDIESATGVPAMYRDQLDWQMGASVAGEADIAAFFASTRQLHIWRFTWDADRFAALREIGADFWFNYVVPEIRPPLDHSPAAKAYLDRLTYDPTLEIAQAPAEAQDLAAEYSEISDVLRKAKQRRDLLRNQLCEIIGERAGIRSWWGKATWKEQQKAPNYKAICAELGEKLAELGVENDVINAIYDRHTGRQRVLRVSYRE